MKKTLKTKSAKKPSDSRRNEKETSSRVVKRVLIDEDFLLPDDDFDEMKFSSDLNEFGTMLADNSYDKDDVF